MASLPPKTSVKRKKYSFGFSSDNPFVASASTGEHLKRRPVVRRKSKHKTLDNTEISAIAAEKDSNQMRIVILKKRQYFFFVKT